MIDDSGEGMILMDAAAEWTPAQSTENPLYIPAGDYLLGKMRIATTQPAGSTWELLFQKSYAYYSQDPDAPDGGEFVITPNEGAVLATFTVVPEPGSWLAISGLGAVGMLFLRRRRPNLCPDRIMGCIRPRSNTSVHQ